MRGGSRLIPVLLAALVLAGSLRPAGAQQALPPFNPGEIYTTEAEFNAAVRVYQEAITANRSNAQAHYWLGKAYLFAFRQSRSGLAPYARRYLSRAIPPLREAIRLNPSLIGAYVALSEALLLNGQRREADRVLRALRAQTAPPPIK